ncbi:hypothetical protein BJY52DRAFT_1125915 [Lactarius psammicola]|nr:hypothetical protein BJY52DRAFT_1125915 [Lactarius psammicola]
MDNDTSAPLSTEPRRTELHCAQHDGLPFIKRFPGQAGAPIPNMGRSTPGYEQLQEKLGLDNIWTPFQSQCDWEFARWAKNRGPTSTAVGELLAIDGVVENLGLSYRNMRELNRIIDNEMPARPRFRCEEVEIGGENFKFYFREVVPCLRTLFGDPEFAKRLVFAPECHYQDSDHTVRVFSEMHTGKWWWSVQQSLEAQNPGATVLPIIISSDKTQLTHFRNKSAYPVYLSIGNIPKDLRRKVTQHAQLLMGYIPTTRLQHIPNKAARHRALANLFHECMHKILSPIESYGENGIAMVTGDGTWYRCHLVLTAVISDYPEQCLVTCTYNGQCPKCIAPRSELGSGSRFPLRDFKTAVSIFALADGNPTIFNAACQEARLKPTYHPFWEQFPYTNIFLSITPDILHQIHQGVTKHLIRWLSTLGSEEIDARCIRLPPSHNARSFPRGITSLSKLTGREHRDICRVLMGVVVDLRLPSHQSPARLVRAVRAILDFIYISQYRVHTVETLNALDDALQRFHDNKEVFIDIGAREHFNIPKFHSLLHYSRSITLFGTADNYNTEQAKRLHIDFTKNAYRATNHKDEYPQMTTWLERQEAIQQQTAFIEWRRCGTLALSVRPVAFSAPTLRLHPLLAIHPSEKGISFEGLALRYRARDFQDALADFIVRHNFPGLSPAAARRRADNTLLPFRCVSVFHKIKFSDSDSEHSNIADVIHIKLERQSQHRALIPGRFDTALVMSASKYRVVQIRVVFRLPKQAASSVFTGSRPPPTDLAYVEWFSPLTPASGGSHGMFRTSRSYHNGQRLAGIIPLADICRSVQLFPVFGPFAPRQWHGSTVLEDCNSFYINPFLDEHIYKNLNVINQNL